MNIKKIDLPSYIKYTHNRNKLLDTLIPFEPPFKFGKEGFYLHNNIAWYEIEDNQYFLADKENFKQALLNLEAYELSFEKKQAILNFVKNAPKKFITQEMIEYADSIERTNYFNINHRLNIYKIKKSIKQKIK